MLTTLQLRIRLRNGQGSIEAQIAVAGRDPFTPAEAPLVIDRQQLIALANDPQAYGRLLWG